MTTEWDRIERAKRLTEGCKGSHRLPLRVVSPGRGICPTCEHEYALDKYDGAIRAHGRKAK